jgi:hypothetical protein
VNKRERKQIIRSLAVWLLALVQKAPAREERCGGRGGLMAPEVWGYPARIT